MTELESNRIFRNALSVEKDFYFERLWLSRLSMSQREGPRRYQLVSRDILLFALSPIWAWIVRKLIVCRKCLNREFEAIPGYHHTVVWSMFKLSVQ